MGESGLDGLPFWLQASSSKTTTCNTLISWAGAIRNQWWWALCYLSILRVIKERLRQCQSAQDSLAHWSIDTACFG